MTTPGTVTVSRSYSDMIVVCKKDPLPDANMTVKSSVKGMAFGNILIGGLVGVIVDTSTGAAYDYPSSFDLEMGMSVMIGARSAATASSSISADPKAAEATRSPTSPAPPPTTPPASSAVTTGAPVQPNSTAPAPAKIEAVK